MFFKASFGKRPSFLRKYNGKSLLWNTQTHHIACVAHCKEQLYRLPNLNNKKNNNNKNKNNNNNNNNNYGNGYKNFFYDSYTLGLLSLLGFTFSYGLSEAFSKFQNVSACGIMAVVGQQEECIEQLLEGLLILQNRGYDSAGIATISSDSHGISVTKHASKGTTSDSLDLLRKEAPKNHKNDTVGLAHTRWATHGAKTDNNAHPHLDYKNRLAIVHNGTIQNSEPIKRELQNLGIPFKSETDTEVIVNLVSYYLDQTNVETGEPFSIEEALKLALSQMEGSWGIAMIAKDRPNEIFAARNGSPLMIGLDSANGRNFIASEHTAFARFTNEYIQLEDGEMVVLSDKALSLDVKADNVNGIDRIKRLGDDMDGNDTRGDGDTVGASDLLQNMPLSGAMGEFSPAPYEHWTLKEMMEQPAAVSRALGYGSRLSFDNQVRLGGLEGYKDSLLSIKHLVMTGCGTSFHAGLYAQRLMQYLHSFDTASVVDAAEVIIDTFPTQGSGLLAISQSGETKDVLNALKVAEMMRIPQFSVVNAVGSMIARKTGCGVYAYAGREHAVASTKAFLSQATVLALISLWFAQHRQEEKKKLLENSNDNNDELSHTNVKTSKLNMFHKDRFRNIKSNKNNNNSRNDKNDSQSSADWQKLENLVSAIHKLPTYTGLTLDYTRDACKKIAKELYDDNIRHMFVLGKGYAEPIAYEGALKVKEITYVHCEGFSGGALKHGPFALIENGTPVVMIILDDEHCNTMLTNAHEITSRGGKCIYITDNTELIESSGLDASRIIKIPRNDVLTALLAVIPLQYIAYELAVLIGHDPDKPKNLAKAVTVD